MLDRARREHGQEPDETSAADLLHVAEREDREAFIRLFARFAPRLKGFFTRRGATPDQAEDLTQETMARVWRYAAVFDPNRGAVATWVFVIARNAWIDHLRQERRSETRERMAMETIPTEPETPSEVFEAGERERLVREALATLSGDQKEILRLNFFLGHTHAQIADKLQLPLGTVKSRARIAMARIRNLLGDLDR